MSDEPKKRLRKWAWGGGTSLAILALYMASIGPATVAFARVDSRIVRRAYRATYAPLYWAGDHCEPLGDAIIEYNSWWLERFP